MTVNRDDKRLRFTPVDQAAKPPSGLIEHLDNRYWVYDKDRGLIFWKPDRNSGLIPQCNQSRLVIERMIKKIYPWAEIKYMESVFRNIDPHDY